MEILGSLIKRKKTKPVSRRLSGISLADMQSKIGEANELKQQRLTELERYGLAQGEGEPICRASLAIDGIGNVVDTDARIEVLFDTRNVPGIKDFIAIAFTGGAEEYIRLEAQDGGDITILPGCFINLLDVKEIGIGGVKFNQSQFFAEILRKDPELLRITRTISEDEGANFFAQVGNRLKLTVMKREAVRGVCEFLKVAGVDFSLAKQMRDRLMDVKVVVMDHKEMNRRFGTDEGADNQGYYDAEEETMYVSEAILREGKGLNLVAHELGHEAPKFPGVFLEFHYSNAADVLFRRVLNRELARMEPQSKKQVVRDIVEGMNIFIVQCLIGRYIYVQEDLKLVFKEGIVNSAFNVFRRIADNVSVEEAKKAFAYWYIGYFDGFLKILRQAIKGNPQVYLVRQFGPKEEEKDSVGDAGGVKGAPRSRSLSSFPQVA